MVNSIPQAQQVQQEPLISPDVQQPNEQNQQQVEEVPQNPSEVLENMEPQAV